MSRGFVSSRFLTLLLAALFASALSRGDPPRHYVHSEADFERHIRLHISRVTRLGESVYRSNPDSFEGVTLDEVREFLALHDSAKISSSETFRRRYWVDPPSEPSFVTRLYSLYGVGYQPPDPELRERIRRTVTSLNATDRAVAMDFFRRKGMLDRDGKPNARALTLLRIERIADVVDRNTDPVAREEFKNPDSLPLSMFLKEPTDLRLALTLQHRYDEITKGLAFDAGSVVEHCPVRFRELGSVAP